MSRYGAQFGPDITFLGVRPCDWADVSTYSSAHDDIQRALQAAIAKQRAAGHTIGPNTVIKPPSRGKKGGVALQLVLADHSSLCSRRR